LHLNIMCLKHESFILLHPSYAFYALPSHDIHVQKLQSNEKWIWHIFHYQIVRYKVCEKLNLCHNRTMCHFGYGSIHKSKHMCFLWVIAISRGFKMCVMSSPIGCSLHKDQTLNTLVILAQKHVSFIFDIVSVLYDIWVLCGELVCVTFMC
jgi:hypothetical protein